MYFNMIMQAVHYLMLLAQVLMVSPGPAACIKGVLEKERRNCTFQFTYVLMHKGIYQTLRSFLSMCATIL